MRPDARTALAPLAAAAARGDTDGVAEAARAAIAAGVTAAEAREALRMVHLFCGFPRALDALAAAAPALGAPPAGVEPLAEDAAAARGRALFDRVYGPDAERVRARLAALDPALTAWVLADAYGRVLARPELAPAERERVAVVLLAAQGLRNQLPGHVRGALNCGASAAQVEHSLAAAEAWIEPDDLALARTALRRGIGPG